MAVNLCLMVVLPVPQVLEKIVHAEVHRLVITDDEQRVIGIISLSDILDALVIRPHGT